MSHVEEPVTKEEVGGGAVTTHPAFAQIVASRVSGGHTNLYGSDFQHNAYMVIRIAPSKLHRGLHRDWYGTGGRDYIEVALSESQWATFVSAPNIGNGPPCTLTYREGIGQIPRLPNPVSRTEQFHGELSDTLRSSIETLERQLAEIDGMGLPKGKANKIKESLSHSIMQLKSNVPYTAQSFGKHMEVTVEKAKQEIHGYMTGVINRAGLTALTSDQMPLAIEHHPIQPGKTDRI